MKIKKGDKVSFDYFDRDFYSLTKVSGIVREFTANVIQIDNVLYFLKNCRNLTVENRLNIY